MDVIHLECFSLRIKARSDVIGRGIYEFIHIFDPAYMDRSASMRAGFSKVYCPLINEARAAAVRDASGCRRPRPTGRLLT